MRVLEDYGEIVTGRHRRGSEQNTVHLLWRDEAQPLITEGVLEKLEDN